MTDAPAKTKSEFIAALAAAIEDQSFIRLTLGKFRSTGETRKAVATLVLLKDVPHLKLVTSLPHKDDTKTFTTNDGINHIKSQIGENYMSAALFSTARDVKLDYSRKGVPHLTAGKPTLQAAAAATHDRAKTYLVAPDRPYLKALEVTDKDGRVKPTMQGKYRQTGHFIEIVDGLLQEADIAKSFGPLSVVDIGSGKGYLTFALYDHLVTKLARDCRVTGIEVRGDLVDFCNGLARDLHFAHLSFKAEDAQKAFAERANVVIALHACDTATDDAMALGIVAGAKLIVSAPCCQHEIAPQIGAPTDGLKGLVKYPLLKQRQADLVTDAARALLLEASGYKVKVIEFVSTEHTAKNILIAGVKSSTVNRDQARRQYHALKDATGFWTQHLAAQLKDVD